MKKIIILTILLILISGCTRITIGKEEIKTTKNNTVGNQSQLLTNLETRIGEKLPKVETSYDTPEIINNRIIDETEAVNFGDVI